MFRRLSRLAATAALTILALGACESTPTNVENARLSILLTDDPGDLHAAVVTISGIYLQGGEEEDAPRVWLSEEEVTTNLLELANDALELVNDVEIPAGSYAQLRFIITGGYIEVEEEGGETRIYATPGYAEVPADAEVGGMLQMPSYEQTGLKVNLPSGGLNVSGTQNVLLVDFVVSESFGQQAGASGMWVMDPVVNAIDFQLSSSVTVSLTLADGVELPGDATLADFVAHLSAEGEDGREAAFEESGEEGVFVATFSFLFPDEAFEVSLEAPEGVEVETDVELPVDVVTEPGADVEVEVVITSAS